MASMWKALPKKLRIFINRKVKKTRKGTPEIVKAKEKIF